MIKAIDRYDDAIEVDHYIDLMKNRRKLFLENIERAEISAEHREFFGSEPIRFLAITEDWCIDSAQFLPVLVKLARELPDVDLRVLRRDENEDLASQYKRKDGYQAIPVIIVLDADGDELGAMIERPEKAGEEMAAETRRFQQANPDLPGVTRNIDRMPQETQAKVKAHSRTWRLDQQDRFATYLLDELREIIEQARAERAA
jgi:thiol-disulfide isomerase/thioredoxin